MQCNFDDCPDRLESDSLKWHRYDPDVLPMWVADMDFRAPEPVIQALHERVEHGVFGYGREPADLRQLIVQRMERLYGWAVAPESIVFLPGVVVGFNLACRAVTEPGDGVLMQTPLYYPMLEVPKNLGLSANLMELTRLDDGRYEVDWERFEGAIDERTRVFILCSPQNPVGRVFTRPELEKMAEICLRHGVTICSDEIHCDIVYEGHPHIPTASIAPEVADNTITIMAPSKTFNIPGLHCSFAIVTNAELRIKFLAARMGLVRGVNVLGFVAGVAAYKYGQPWLDELRTYLTANRDYLVAFVNTQLPGITTTAPEGMFLAWLDCRNSRIPGSASEFFLEKSRVAMNEGKAFGAGGEGFLRFNFGCSRARVQEALERMREALLTL